MTPTLLTRVGVALYGQQWQTQLAAALGITARHVRRWVAGVDCIPDARRADLARLVRERETMLWELASELRSLTPERTITP